jgi:hypothetical protein
MATWLPLPLLQTHTVATEKRFVVRADEKLSAFLELESAIRGSAVLQSRKIETITHV